MSKELSKISQNVLYRHLYEYDANRWNEFGRNPNLLRNIACDCVGYTVRNLDLSNMLFNGSDIKGLHFMNCVFDGASFFDTHLCNVKFYDCNLEHVNFDKAYLEQVSIKNSYINGYFVDTVIQKPEDLLLVNSTFVHDSYGLSEDVRAALELSFPLACPEEGSFIAFKKAISTCCQLVVVKLEIPSDAKRSSAFGRKCRCSKAKVLDIEVIETGGHIQSACSIRTFETDGVLKEIYKVGEYVEPDWYDEDRFNECSGGIHFFPTKIEAVNYVY